MLELIDISVTLSNIATWWNINYQKISILFVELTVINKYCLSIMINTICVSRNTVPVSNVLKRQLARLRIGEVGPTYVVGRCQSSLAKSATAIDNDSIYVLSVPITNYKSYIFCNHQPSVLDSTQVKSILWVNKLEDKLTSVASKGWKKLNQSEVKINVKIVKLVNKLLDTIPYEENCLKSFPSQKSMIREVNEEYTKQAAHSSTRLIQSQADKLQIPSNQIKPIPLYHPKFQSPTTILNQLYLFRDDAYKTHLKYSILCAIGIPISLPFALVPVLPNVPGFYLAFRLYCNVKALLGVKHLDYLLEDCTHSSSEPANKSAEKKAIETTVNDTKHIAFQDVDHLDAVYLSNTLLDDLNLLTEEKVIITPEIIDSLCKKFNLPHLKDDLHKALRQESHRLEKAEQTTVNKYL